MPAGLGHRFSLLFIFLFAFFQLQKAKGGCCHEAVIWLWFLQGQRRLVCTELFTDKEADKSAPGNRHN